MTSVATTVARRAGQVQGLDAAAGAEVEGPADRLAQVSWASEVEAGLIAEHVVGATRIGRPSSPGVRSLTTHSRGRRRRRGGSRARRAPRHRAVEHPLGDEPVDQPGQRPLGGRARSTGVWSRKSRARVCQR